MKTLILITFTVILSSCAPLNISDNQRAQTLMWLADKWSQPNEPQDVVGPPASLKQCFPVDNGYYTQIVCQ